MKCVAIDTSGKHLTILVIDGKKEYCYFDKECGVNHSVDIMTKLESLIEKAGLNLNELDFFACVIGAGSFTGIRIGVSTIKAMCFAYKKPCLAITSFDTLSYNKQCKGKVLSIIDAGHDGFYVAGYEDYKIIKEPCYILKDKVIELLKEYNGISSQKISGIKTKKVCVEQGLKNAIKEKYKNATYDYNSLEPLYVRKSQAEEGRL